METPDENAPRQLPADLPRSLDDRKPSPQIAGETEIYDAWQGALPAPNTPFSTSN